MHLLSMARTGRFEHTWCVHWRHILLLQSTIPAWQERHRSRRGLGQYQVDGQRSGGAICRDWWAIWQFWDVFGGKGTLSDWCAFSNRYKSPLKKRFLLNLQTWGVKQGMPCLKARHLTPNPGTGQKGGHLLGKWWNNHRALAADGGWLRELELGWNVKNPDVSWGINKK